MWAALLVELVMTALFVFVILSVTDARNEHPALAPLAIGLTLAMIHFMLIPADRHVGQPRPFARPRLFSGVDWITQVWLFLIAPFIGGGLAGLAYPALFGHATEPVAGSGLNFGGRGPLRCLATARPTSTRSSGTSPSRATSRPRPGCLATARPTSTSSSGTSPLRATRLRMRAPMLHRYRRPSSRSSRTAGSGTRRPSSGSPPQQPPPQQGWPPEGGSEATQVRPPDA